jgi:hypothetical protein
MQNLFTNKKSDWITDIEENEIQPYIIQRVLCMNDSLRIQVRWLDKYVFNLPPKMYLSLAWSVLPKSNRVPYSKYIKQINEEDEFDFIFSKIRKQFCLADNDFNCIKSRLLNAIKNDMENWFSYYGIQKKYWKKYHLNFNLIKKFGERKYDGQKGLDKWGI